MRVLLFADVALPQHGSGGHIITTEQMRRMSLRARRAHRFAVNCQVGMLAIALVRLKTRGFASTALFGFEADEEGRKQFIEQRHINARQHPTIGHLTRHLFSA